jgi:hypothetical protein
VFTGFWLGNLREDLSEYPGVNGRIILKWILDYWVGGHGLGRSESGQGEVAGSCHCDNEPSVSVKCVYSLV